MYINTTRITKRFGTSALCSFLPPPSFLGGGYTILQNLLRGQPVPVAVLAD